MASHVIVDGYNVIRRIPALADRERESLEAGRRALLDLLADYRRAAGHRLTVVFDGVAEGGVEEAHGRDRGVHVVYTSRGTRADETIVRLARDSSQGAVVVVTADREVARQAERRGAAVVTPAAFAAKLDAATTPREAEASAEDLPGDPFEGRGDDEPEAARSGKRGNPRKAPRRARRAARRLEKL